jgi:hypothetical protein
MRRHKIALIPHVIMMFAGPEGFRGLSVSVQNFVGPGALPIFMCLIALQILSTDSGSAKQSQKRVAITGS